MDIDRFLPLQGQRFGLHTDDGGVLPTELQEIAPLPMAAFGARQPFRLLFRGPTAPVLPQRIYRFSLEGEADPFEIFVVPVMADASGVSYEAVFT